MLHPKRTHCYTPRGRIVATHGGCIVAPHGACSTKSSLTRFIQSKELFPYREKFRLHCKCHSSRLVTRLPFYFWAAALWGTMPYGAITYGDIVCNSVFSSISSSEDGALPLLIGRKLLRRRIVKRTFAAMSNEVKGRAVTQPRPPVGGRVSQNCSHCPKGG